MKKTLLVLGLFLCFVSISFGSWFDSENLTTPLSGTAKTSATTPGNYTKIQWSAPGGGSQNCISDLSVGSNAGMTVNIIEGITSGTTIYSLYVSSGIPLVETWSMQNPLCTSGNAGMVISPSFAPGISPGTLVGTTYYINASGYVKGRP